MTNSPVQPRSELTRQRPSTKATTAAGERSAGRTFSAASEATTVRSVNHLTLAGKAVLVSVKLDAARIQAGCNIAPILVTDMASVTL